MGRVLAVRDRADIVAPAGGDAVYLVEIGWEPVVEGERAINVGGVTVGMSGATAVTVEVDLGAGAVRVPATLGSNGAFRASLTVPAGPGITGTARAANDGGIGTDLVAFALVAGEVELPEHRVHTVGPDRVRYTAGTPDRLHYVRTFVKLEPSPYWVDIIGRRIFGEPGEWYRLDHQRIATQVHATAASARAQVAAGTLSTAAYRRAAADEVRASVTGGLVRIRGRAAAKGVTQDVHGRGLDWFHVWHRANTSR
jgi:hypothetical protein